MRGIHFRVKNSNSWTEADKSDLMSYNAGKLHKLRQHLNGKLQVALILIMLIYKLLIKIMLIYKQPIGQ